MMYLLLYFFLYTVYLDVITSRKIHLKYFSCISTSSLSFAQRFFEVKTLLRTQLKQTTLQSRLHILTEIPKEGFNNTVFQNFVDGLKQCNPDMQMDLQLFRVFSCLYSIYLIVMLTFRMILFLKMFCFISFSYEFAIFYSLVTRFISNFY